MAAKKKSGGRSRGAGSLLSQAWRSDPDLKSPKHDRMSLAMTNREFVRRMILESSGFREGAWRRESKDGHCDGERCSWEGEEQRSGSVEVRGVHLEVPVLRKWQSGSSTVGFWDAVAAAYIQAERCNFRCMGARHNHFIAGAGWNLEHRDEKYFIEAKTSMTNPMEVLRQVKFYRAEQKEYGHTLIWCPGMDKLYADAFRAEGILTWDGEVP